MYAIPAPWWFEGKFPSNRWYKRQWQKKLLLVLERPRQEKKGPKTSQFEEWGHL